MDARRTKRATRRSTPHAKSQLRRMAAGFPGGEPESHAPVDARHAKEGIREVVDDALRGNRRRVRVEADGDGVEAGRRDQGTERASGEVEEMDLPFLLLVEWRTMAAGQPVCRPEDPVVPAAGSCSPPRTWTTGSSGRHTG